MADLASVRRVHVSKSTRSSDPPRTPPTGPRVIARPRILTTMSQKQAQDYMKERRSARSRPPTPKDLVWARFEAAYARPCPSSVPAAQALASKIGPATAPGTARPSSMIAAQAAAVIAPAIQSKSDAASSAKSESLGNGGSPRRSPRYGKGSPSPLPRPSVQTLSAVATAASPPPLLPVRHLVFLDSPATQEPLIAVAAGVPRVAGVPGVGPASEAVFKQQQSVPVTAAVALAPAEAGAAAPVGVQGPSHPSLAPVGVQGPSHPSLAPVGVQGPSDPSLAPVGVQGPSDPSLTTSSTLPAARSPGGGHPAIPRRPRELAHLRMWTPETSWQPWREEEEEVPAAPPAAGGLVAATHAAAEAGVKRRRRASGGTTA